MGKTFTSITKQGDGSWLFAWAAGAAPYRVLLRGEQVAQAAGESYVWALPGYEASPPPLEVVDAGSVGYSETYPSYLDIQWLPSSGAAYYVVEQYDGASWGQVREIQESGAAYYSHRLYGADGQALSGRVKAVSAGGDSSYIQFDCVLACPPAPPSLTLSYAAGNVNVIGA